MPALPERLPDLQAALELNQRLSVAYYLKEELRTLWGYRDIEEMASFLDDWIRRAMESGIALLTTFAGLARTRNAPIKKTKTIFLNSSVSPSRP